jgi:hypothetical protein
MVNPIVKKCLKVAYVVFGSHFIFTWQRGVRTKV